MQLTSEGLLPYPGIAGMDGLCHIRVYQTPGRTPVVIVGQLDDNPGTAINNAIETIAGLINTQVLDDGREFQLITYHNTGGPPYSHVTFEHRPLGDHQPEPSDYDSQTIITNGTHATMINGNQIIGDFRNPAWQHVPDISTILGHTPVEPIPGEYTAESVAGTDGARPRDRTTSNSPMI